VHIQQAHSTKLPGITVHYTPILRMCTHYIMQKVNSNAFRAKYCLHFHHNDTSLWNAGNHLLDYVSHPRRPLIYHGMFPMFCHDNNIHSSIRNTGCLQVFSSLLGSWR
jgi:hypothetical protein